MSIDALLQAAEYLERRERGINPEKSLCVVVLETKMAFGWAVNSSSVESCVVATLCCTCGRRWWWCRAGGGGRSLQLL